MNRTNACVAAVLILTALTQPSCRPDDRDSRPLEKLPRIDDLAPRTRVRADPYPGLGRTMPAAWFERLWLPLATPMDEVWSLADTHGLPASTVDLWRANGMRIGMVAADRVARFREAVASFTGIDRGRVTGATHWVPLRTMATLQQPVRIVVVEQTGRPRLVLLRRGRVQFLIRLERDDSGTTRLELVPHHHVRQVTIEPRTPLETLLDGRIFESLELKIALEPDRLLLVGLDTRPVPGRLENREGKQDDADATSSQPPSPEEMSAEASVVDDTAASTDADDPDSRATGTRPLSPAQIDVPYHLGRMLLTANRLNRPSQMLLFMGVHEPPDAAVDEGGVDRPTRRLIRRLRKESMRHQASRP